MRVKYPRTFHLPWSEGATKDDKTLDDISHFEGKEVVVTEKMDGENTSIYSDGYIHARSIDSGRHSSRSWVNAFAPSITERLPKGWRLCGENLYAKHSIHYKLIESYFYGFSIWTEHNICINFVDMIDLFRKYNLESPPILYRGVWDTEQMKDMYDRFQSTTALGYSDDMEGYVVRVVEEFHYDDFNTSVAKFVRGNHVQTDEHWIKKEVVKNLLKGN